MATPRIDFDAIKRAALSRIEDLLEQWLPGGRWDGREYVALNPTRADRNLGSFRINIKNCVWKDFATGDAGGDPVNLYAFLFGLKQIDAARELGQALGIIERDEATPLPARAAVPPPASAETQKKRKRADDSEWTPMLPAPKSAPTSALRHFHYGDPLAVWEYRDLDGQLLGYVRRFQRSGGGKETIPLTFCRDKGGIGMWRDRAFPAPRPLYGLPRLASAQPGTAVLVVEGEKCADAGHNVQSELSVISWPGGGKAVAKADWMPLAGRKVILWPDCDAQREKLTKDEQAQGVDPESKPLLPEAEQPGVMAMEEIAQILLALNCEVHIVNIPGPGEKPAGWDIADAVAEGWTEAALLDYLRTKLRLPVPVSSKPSKRGKTSAQSAPDDVPPPDDAAENAVLRWEAQLMRHPESGKILPTLGNVERILTHAKEWKGLIAYDEFSGRTMKLRPPPYDHGQAGEWNDTDDILTMLWLERAYGLIIKKPLVIDGVIAGSEANAIYPLKEYLESRVWDSVARLKTWLKVFLGAQAHSERTQQYLELVGIKWMVSAVARIYQPGCKADSVLVLDGPQGIKKSTALRVLAGDEYFTDAPFRIGDKEGYDIIRGKWLVELSEMDSFYKAESTSAKRFFSQSEDRYRLWYGKRSQDIKRRSVFAGTVNESNYLKDPTGNRRYWPVSCTVIDIVALKKWRDQLWAEAVALFRAGTIWYVTDEERPLFESEQEDRYQGDAYEDLFIHFLGTRTTTTLVEMLEDCLKLDKSKWTRQEQKRVVESLHRLGFERFRMSVDHEGRRAWGYRKVKDAARKIIGDGGEKDREPGDDREQF